MELRPRPLTTKEAADYLGVCCNTVRRYTIAGLIACFRTPGGQRRFLIADLDKFWNDRFKDVENKIWNGI